MIITIVNQTHGTVPQADLRRVVAALNTQLTRDFTPWWGMTGQVVVSSNGKVANTSLPDVQDLAVIYLVDKINVQGALGYHDVTNTNIPYGYVDVQLSAKLGEPWSVTLSHEVLELIGDPQTNTLVMGPHPTAKYDVFYWYEMCDAVQDEHYVINNVTVSNFVLPAYFTPTAGRTSFLNQPLAPFHVRPGGYVGFYDPQLKSMDTYMMHNDPRARYRSETKATLGAVRRAARYAGQLTTKTNKDS